MKILVAGFSGIADIIWGGEFQKRMRDRLKGGRR